MHINIIVKHSIKRLSDCNIQTRNGPGGGHLGMLGTNAAISLLHLKTL
jgi:hypothetical protein